MYETHDHACACAEPQPPGLLRRLSRWRAKQLLRNALSEAGEPGLVLDLGCGVGRFWPVLGEHGNRVILAADHSQDVLNHARTHHPASLLARIRTFQSSAFNIGLSENAVDCIVCSTLFARLDSAEARMALLRECQRVSRDTVILCVGIKACLRLGPDLPGPLLSKSTAETEFKAAGFEILMRQDLCPGFSSSRTYVLRKTSQD
ncbi:Methyltransferase domain-containing protein [Pseudomonas sp. ok272]|uniref:class I SAM-dependent methyltransferase n=1 Tax=unclassified Pseudomonas TaxID=196821 RepID=UPI0008BFDAC6|nr:MULTISPECIES: class I SAM-dependent methyltransferase [unclassified Pseudomonas]SEM39351.1 Methyltransferase domain-containing protein [Pseudomonas sp. ok272]SFN31940.1 Methyltransferase domain-containing protein [Pseudomonas sp. ok602]